MALEETVRRARRAGRGGHSRRPADREPHDAAPPPRALCAWCDGAPRASRRARWRRSRAGSPAARSSRFPSCRTSRAALPRCARGREDRWRRGRRRASGGAGAACGMQGGVSSLTARKSSSAVAPAFRPEDPLAPLRRQRRRRQIHLRRRGGAAPRATTRRVLLLSTDPAHSLGDVFGARVRQPAARRPRRARRRCTCARSTPPRRWIASGGKYVDGGGRGVRADRADGGRRPGGVPRSDRSRAAGHRRSDRGRGRRRGDHRRQRRATTSSSPTPRRPGTRCGCCRPRRCCATGRWR